MAYKYSGFWTDHNGKLCPVCGDVMTETHSNFAPVWADSWGDVVCTWCADHTVTRCACDGGQA